MKPIVSIFMSTIRPYNWLIQHKNFSTSSTPFEMICVGPAKPDFTMPDNMKFIYSEVKPAQCVHIGVQAATGKYIMSCPDDLKYTNACLDRLVNEAENCPNIDNTIITPKFTQPGQSFFGDEDNSTPILPVGMFLTKELWDRYGIDKNFHGIMWDTDIAMMNYEDGGTIIICKEVTAVHIHPDLPVKTGELKSTVAPRSTADRSLFYAMWIKDFLNDNTLENDGNFQALFHKTSPPRGSWIRKERAKPLDPIVDSDDILTVSQGVQ